MSTQIRQAASDWFVEFRAGEPNEAARRAFHAWLQESPAHMAAYLEIAALWNESASLDVRAKWPLQRLIEEARTDPGNIIPLEVSPVLIRPPRASNARVPRLVPIAASLIIMLAVATGVWLYTQRDTYTTGIGEQRSLMLSDGSRVELNASTAIRIRYAVSERHVDLLRGQALFTVAKNKDRPFVVQSNGARVRAVGTRFDVNQRSSATVVTVLEGTVAITPPVARRQVPSTSMVMAGQQLTVGPAAAVKASRAANLAAAIAWTQRQLIFDNAPLNEVANEFNRYNARQLIVRDPQLENFTIDGVFSSTNPTSLIRFLRSRPGVVVTETDSEIIVTSR